MKRITSNLKHLCTIVRRIKAPKNLEIGQGSRPCNKTGVYVCVHTVLSVTLRPSATFLLRPLAVVQHGYKGGNFYSFFQILLFSLVCGPCKLCCSINAALSAIAGLTLDVKTYAELRLHLWRFGKCKMLCPATDRKLPMSCIICLLPIELINVTVRY